MKRILAISVFFLLSCCLQAVESSFVLCHHGRIISTTAQQREQQESLLQSAKPLGQATSDRSTVIEQDESSTSITAVSRRLALQRGLIHTANTSLLLQCLVTTMITTTTTTASPPLALAATVKQSIKPDDAFASILKAREELITAAETYLPKRDFEGLRMYFTDNASNLKNFEVNSQALLQSKLLDTESKRAIGTIRTYGVGADVMIMYGGLQAELNEDPPDSAQVSKYLMRTLDSLSEVISICRSNGFGGGGGGGTAAYSEKTNACIDSVCT